MALRGGLWVEGRGAADALGTRLRMSLQPLEWRVILTAEGGGAGCRLHSVFTGRLCCSASFTRLLPLLQKRCEHAARAWLPNNALATRTQHFAACASSAQVLQ